MLQFYFGLYGLALFLCFLGFLYALTEKAYKWLTSGVNKSHLPNYPEAISSCSNHNETIQKRVPNILEVIESNNLMDAVKIDGISECPQSQENTRNQLDDSDISTPSDEMKTIMNGKYTETNPDQVHQASIDTSMKSFSERRQERRKRYKAKKSLTFSSPGCFSTNSSMDDYDNGNAPVEDSDETTNASNCSMLSDSNELQPDYFILETHNMCELRKSIPITNLDDSESGNIDNNNNSIGHSNNYNNYAMDKSDSLDITLKSSYKTMGE
ncbi:unnamed protein product [Schistosoma turkestanicum]|nr:unnamed protein product [Schistosoma turkestanicum]